MKTDERTGYTCFLLDLSERQSILDQFPPEYSNVIVHHITIAYDVPQSTKLPYDTVGYIVGEIYDHGVQALVVEIDGKTTKTDGSIYHITVSLSVGRYPENSKTLVKRGWWPLASPIAIKLIPAFITSKLKI